MEKEHLDDLVADAVDGTERRHRLLEDERDLGAADRAHLAAIRVELREIDGLPGSIPTRPVKMNLALDDPPRPIDDPENRSRGHALATSTFAHDPERRPRRHVEAHAIHRFAGPFI